MSLAGSQPSLPVDFDNSDYWSRNFTGKGTHNDRGEADFSLSSFVENDYPPLPFYGHIDERRVLLAVGASFILGNIYIFLRN
jgi:hypothetical protein